MIDFKDGYAILCRHITIYYNNKEELGKLSIQCKICEAEFFLGIETNGQG